MIPSESVCECRCVACAKTPHASDCAVHNEPASPPGPCDCGASEREGWTPLQFYAYIVRTLGIPDRFRFVGDGWVADAPFTTPSAQTIALLESHGV